MSIAITLPTAEEEELIRRFTVNKNYLQALRGYLFATYGRHDDLYRGLGQVVRAHPAFARTSGGSSTQIDDVRRYLTLGWTSEIQLVLPAAMGQRAIIGFANAWAPVHAYYTAFGLLQAWFAANGMSGTANDHVSMLRSIASMIQQRNLFPPPWNLLAIGCPMRGEKTYINCPAGEDCAAKVEVLSVPVPFGRDGTFWQRYGTWLRTTREARLTAREGQWKKEKGMSRVSPAARSHIAASVAPTSLFDCLWRLRIKSNYGVIDPYLVAWIGESDHVVFNNALRALTDATAGLLELYIARRVGRLVFARIAADFLGADSSGLSSGIENRLRCMGLLP